MPLPYIFANVTQILTPQFDADFAAVGAIGVTPCTISGTNSLVLTPLANTPTISALANYQRLSGIATATNSGSVTVNVSALGPLPVYKDTSLGPVVLTGGEIIDSNTVEFIYDASLNAGGGGFHVNIVGAAVGGTVVSVGTGTGLTGGPITTSGTISLAAIASHAILANITGGSADPIPNTLTAILDAVLGNTEGGVIYRGASVWTLLTPGTVCQPFITNGASAIPQWGNSVSAAVAAAGSTQGTATVLTTLINAVTSTPSSTGVLMFTCVGSTFKIFNRGANTLTVYPPSGAAIDGNAANAGVSISANAAASYTCVSTTQFYTG